MTRGEDDRLEAKLGVRFKNRALLEQALTHSSAVPELRASRDDGKGDSPEIGNNERLEFLGDAVLDLLASEYLLENFPDWSEGQLSKSRARLVNARSLERAARKIELGEHLRLGRGEEKTGGRDKPALLADGFEAVVAAVFLDAGLQTTGKMLKRILFDQALEERGERIADSDRKSALQEILQRSGRPPADYRLVAESGPDHKKVFLVEVWADGNCLGRGEGKTKKEAEQQAARAALLQWEEATPNES
ncbi:MAG TPA: ribonuclease III [Candidatus Eremiobacteraceae bacterium]|nr:ribonuclease III [Candidatus Eremiobacteraceae bacterium]